MDMSTQEVLKELGTLKEQMGSMQDRINNLEQELEAGAKLYRGAGCRKCRNTGYHGRLGLYEQLVIDDVCRDLISRNPTVTEMRKTVKERGMVSIREDGYEKVLTGQTTIEEVVRVTEEIV